MANTDPITLAYLAGCIDSDGSITIRRDFANVRTGRRDFPQYSETISLRQVTPDVPHLLQRTFGGYICISKSQLPNGKDLHAWHITSRKAAAALSALLPFLRIKATAARIALRLRDDKIANPPRRNSRGTYARVVAADVRVADDLYKEIRFFNSGVIVP